MLHLRVYYTIVLTRSLSLIETIFDIVPGTMEGVDQDTAYSWPECNMCGSNQIEGDSRCVLQYITF